MATVHCEKTDALQCALSVQLLEADYRPNYEKSLRNLAGKVQLQGFRKGKVPLTLIERMYGKAALWEEMIKVSEQQLWEYIEKEKLSILFQPLLSERTNGAATCPNPAIYFDIALRPEVDLSFLDTLNLPNYKVQVQEDLVSQEVERRLMNAATPIAKEVLSEQSLDYLRLQMEGTGKPFVFSLMMKHVEVSCFERLKTHSLGDTITLSIDKDIVPDFQDTIKHEWAQHQYQEDGAQLTIKAIQSLVLPAMDEDFFKKHYPKNEAVRHEQAFREQIKQEITDSYAAENERFLTAQLTRTIRERKEIPLPESFIRRWINHRVAAQEEQNKKGKQPESVQIPKSPEEWAWVFQSVREQVVINSVVEQAAIQIDEATLKEYVMETLKARFFQYDLDELALEQLLKSAWQDQEFMRKMAEECTKQQALRYMLQKASRAPEEVTDTAFRAIVEKYYKEISQQQEKTAYES